MIRHIERFTIRAFANPSGRTVWRIQGRKLDGARFRKNFKTLAEARLQKQKLDIETLNRQAGSVFRQTRLNDRQLAEAEAAYTLLGEKPLLEAVRIFLSRGGQELKPITVAEAVDAYLAEKKDLARLRDRSLQDYRSRLNPVKTTYGPRQLQSVTRDELEALIFLPGRSPDTSNGNRRVLHGLFEWGLNRDHVRENIVARIATASRDQKEPEIFSVCEVRKLLLSAGGHKAGVLLPYLVLGLFCGMRPAEICRLENEQIDLNQKHITVRGEGAKLRKRRVIELSDTAVAWLKTCVGKSISPENFMREFDAVRRLAGYQGNRPRVGDERLMPWPQDGIRHTAISCELARSKDEAATAAWAGNSPETVHRYYKGLVTPGAGGGILGAYSGEGAGVHISKGRSGGGDITYGKRLKIHGDSVL